MEQAFMCHLESLGRFMLVESAIFSSQAVILTFCQGGEGRKERFGDNWAAHNSSGISKSILANQTALEEIQPVHFCFLVHLAARSVEGRAYLCSLLPDI